MYAIRSYYAKELESPAINYQLADLLLENRSFAEAGVEYEKTAYDYSRHEKSSVITSYSIHYTKLYETV